MLRLQSEGLLASDGNPADAQALCRDALALAQQQQARWPALRCTLTLHALVGDVARASLAEALPRSRATLSAWTARGQSPWPADGRPGAPWP